MQTDADDEAISRVVDLLQPSSRLLFVTGAGLSADSGMPTYRDVGGLYEGKLTTEGLPIEMIVSGTMLRNRPELTWRYLKQIGDSAKGVAPNRGHEVIAEMERHFPNVWTLTQNVDGLHRLAGSKNVIDIHGDMRRLLCTGDGCGWTGESETFPFDELPPHCPECFSIVRPDVVLFGEMLDPDKMERYDREWAKGFDIVFAVGTTGSFPYIAEPLELAKEAGIPTVEINPGRTELTPYCTIRIALGAAAALDAIWTWYQEKIACDSSSERHGEAESS